MKRKWNTKRKWEVSKAESKFVALLVQDGFEIKGIREYCESTDYLVEKDSIEVEYKFQHIQHANAKHNFDWVVMMWNQKKELLRLRALVAQKG